MTIPGQISYKFLTKHILFLTVVVKSHQLLQMCVFILGILLSLCEQSLCSLRILQCKRGITNLAIDEVLIGYGSGLAVQSELLLCSREMFQ